MSHGQHSALGHTVFQRDFGALTVGTQQFQLNVEGVSRLIVQGKAVNSTGTTTVKIKQSPDGGATYPTDLDQTVTLSEAGSIVNVAFSKALLEVTQATAPATKVIIGVAGVA